jgi:hypothetical protein
MPLWCAFDLDQTIGCFDSVYSYLVVFFPDMLQQVFKAPYYKGAPYPKLDIDRMTKATLAHSYYYFVRWMANNEDKNKLLRPGIIPILNLLLRAKSRGLVGGIMIYSNNSNPYILKFASDLIRAIMGHKGVIFNPMISWWHPLRNAEVRGRPDAELCHGPKTVATIQRAFISLQVQATISLQIQGTGATQQVIPTSDILFFDDLIHSAIYNVIPAQNYFHVQPYYSPGEATVIHQCFLNALMTCGIDVTAPFFSAFEAIGVRIGDPKTFISGRGLKRGVTDAIVIIRRLEALLAVGHTSL